MQAVTLEMAAAQAFGRDNYAKLDPLTISLAPPDATIGLISGVAEFDSAFSVPPYQNHQSEHPGIHTVLNSFDVLGRAQLHRRLDEKRFHDANPKLYGALIAALKEAPTSSTPTGAPLRGCGSRMRSRSCRWTWCMA